MVKIVHVCKYVKWFICTTTKVFFWGFLPCNLQYDHFKCLLNGELFSFLLNTIDLHFVICDCILICAVFNYHFIYVTNEHIVACIDSAHAREVKLRSVFIP